MSEATVIAILLVALVYVFLTPEDWDIEKFFKNKRK